MEESSFEGKKVKVGSFQSLGLEKELLQGISRLGYKVPTPIQRKSLPVVLAGIDIVCMARTGSGKTGVFLIPMIQKLKKHNATNAIRAVLLSPTRELAVQTLRFAKDLAKFTDLRIVSVVGGDSIDAQFDTLAAKPDVIIATPGRLMHLLQEIPTFHLSNVQYLVFDEADRLFEMGFAEQLNEIVKRCPVERQTLLFSATMPKMLMQFSRAGLRDPQLIRLDTDVKMSEELRLAFLTVRSNEKMACLLYLVRNIIPADQLTIIFTATKHHSEFIHSFFHVIGIRSTLVYGSMDQEARNMNLKDFRLGHVKFLIVTDLAARGIDVPLLNNVINFHFPASPKLFVHRCGRAARQGRIGYAFSIIDPEELPYMVDVHKFLGYEIQNRYESGDKNCYDLKTMTPSMVHVGLLPQDVLDSENELVKKLLHDEEILSNAWRISENGMQQYRRTRPEATKTGVKVSRELVKSGAIFSIHPLIMGCDPSNCNADVIEKAQFIKMLQTFRPAQTVFESGIGTGTAQGATKNVSKTGSKESQGALAMKALRKANNMLLERNRKSLSLNDESDSKVEDLNHDSGDDDDSEDENDDDHHDSNLAWDEDDIGDTDEFPVETTKIEDHSSSDVSEKPRLSIAERKKLKKQGLSNEEMSKIAAEKKLNNSLSIIQSSKTDFKDSRYFMSYGTEDERQNYAEEVLQPKSGLRTSEAQGMIGLLFFISLKNTIMLRNCFVRGLYDGKCIIRYYS